MIVQLDSGEPRALSANYVANHLRHAYPLTARGAQGATVHWARVIGRPREFRREWGYAAAIPLVAIALAANLEPPAWQLARPDAHLTPALVTVIARLLPRSSLAIEAATPSSGRPSGP
jgi:hypothetical protein